MTESFIFVTVDSTDKLLFKNELFKKYPNATIEWLDEKPDFCKYVVRSPSKAMAKRIMWELGREKSLRIYWRQKLWKFYDSDTNERIQLYSHFVYRSEAWRKEYDNKHLI